MAKPCYTYFDTPFLYPRMDRPAYQTQARCALRAVEQAALGPAFVPLLAGLETVINGFNENPTGCNRSTAGGTDACHLGRTV